MRAAPHGVKAGSPAEAFENVFEEAALTHLSWEARTSAGLVACLVAHLADGAAPEEALESAYSVTEGRKSPGGAPGRRSPRWTATITTPGAGPSTRPTWL
jgi:ADP-ribosylglycohydrolase